MKRLFCVLSISILLVSELMAVPVTVLYDESAMGVSPLSNNNMLPTDLGVLSLGLNRLTGLISRAASSGNVDVFKFEVPAGLILDGVFVVDYGYTFPNGGDANAFLGINDADTFPYDVFGLDFNNNPDFDERLFLGGTLFGLTNDPTENILESIGRFAGRRFVPPLPADTYTVYIQQTGPENFYTLDFAVSPVPEPAHVSLAVMGMVGIVALRRRLRNKRLAVLC